MNDILNKYLALSRERQLNGLRLGELCEYCLSIDSAEVSITGSRVCSHCTAEMPQPLIYCFGVPVYDPADYLVLTGSE
jgi:hypothetical protein